MTNVSIDDLLDAVRVLENHDVLDVDCWAIDRVTKWIEKEVNRRDTKRKKGRIGQCGR